jgi:hypothetical protein
LATAFRSVTRSARSRSSSARGGIYTIKDLVVGSGLRFQDRGLHVLKGVPDEWHLYKAAAG